MKSRSASIVVSTSGSMPSSPVCSVCMTMLVTRGIDAVAVGSAEHVRDLARDVGIGQDPGAHGVVDVVVDIGDLVGLADDLPLKRLRQTAVTAMAEDAHAHLVGRVQPCPSFFEDVHHTQRLFVVAEGSARHLRERDLPAWPKGVCPRSWPKAIASAKSSFSRRARVIVRAMRATSSVCVMRVR